MDKRFEQAAFFPADILLPQVSEMEKWPVVACDQFTSQPEYWENAEKIVGDAPSALRLVLPEAYLNSAEVNRRIAAINASMEGYLADGVFKTLPDSLIYLERTQSDDRVRHGLIGCIDLEQYDFTPGSGALIRATEGTVLERIPPRVRVREHAPLELPHVMLLIDDPNGTVIEPLAGETGRMETLYDTELMLGGGHVKGWRLTDEQMSRAAAALNALKSPEVMAEKYGMVGAAPLLFAVGDGNHSLATAKACYEKLKKETPEAQWASLPARYALVEVVNLHDDALTFEPIHRVLFHVDGQDLWAAFRAFYPAAHTGAGAGHTVEVCGQGLDGVWTVPAPSAQLAVGTLQAFLDDYCKRRPEVEIDYIHGDDVARKLGSQPGNLGFLLPPMGKDQLFRTVMADGVLPRKTFSMGEAQDKRYYLEARKIR